MFKTSSSRASNGTRNCFRSPIAEIEKAAAHLEEALAAHHAQQTAIAEERIRLANIPAIRDWVESIWGAASPHIGYRKVPGSPPILEKANREIKRMPSAELKRTLHFRDGYHCRFCSIPVIRSEVRVAIRTAYPNALEWGRKNITQHAAFQAMWAQYDHVLPHARGGGNDIENIVVTCAACNYGRMDYTLEEVGLEDPRNREPFISTWTGLEGFLMAPKLAH